MDENTSSPMVVVVACSAGGLTGLLQLVGGLGPDFPAAIAVVQHRSAQHPNLLIELLTQRTPLQVRHAQDGARLEAGVVYVCPPGVHMVMEPTIRLLDGPRLRHVQPSADAMLRSTAQTHGARAIAIVLSGAGNDGALGARMVAEAGGKVLVQDPASCSFPSMPSAAMAAARVDLVVAPEELAEAARQMVASALAETPAPLPVTEQRIRVILADDHRITRDGLRTMLAREPDIDVVGEAEDGHGAVLLALQLAPDVVVMDVSMPDLDGISATRQIRGKRPSTTVVALSGHTDRDTAQRVMAAGAFGYVCKTEAFEELPAAIRSAAARRPYLTSRLTQSHP